MEVSILTVLLSVSLIVITFPKAAILGMSTAAYQEGNGVEYVLLESGMDLEGKKDYQCDRDVCKAKVCNCCPGWGLLEGNIFRETVCAICNCGEDFNCTFSGIFKQKTCLCPDGYSQVNGICRDKCLSVRCKNGGFCVFINGKTVCNCTDRYTGDTCQKDKCGNVKCQNGGLCDFVNGKQVCNCTDRYEGDLCETDKCATVECQNGGLCDFVNGKQVCNCTDKYEGDLCEKVVQNFSTLSPSSAMPTTTRIVKELENATSDVLYRRTTELPPSTTALQCEKFECRTTVCNCCPGWVKRIPAKNFCEKCNCGGEFNCSFTYFYGEKKCHCPEGYYDYRGVCKAVQESSTSFPSTLSTTGTRPCSINPCRNGGICRLENYNIKCYCVSPFRGKFCEKDPCSDQPCQNDGKCYADGDDYRCVCGNRYSGRYCENDLCGSNPCQKGGFCEIEDGIPKWFCYVPHGEEVCDNKINSRIIIIFSAACAGLAILLLACLSYHCIRHLTKRP